MEWKEYEYNGKRCFEAEGVLPWHIARSASEDAEKLVKQIKCPCGCGTPKEIRCTHANCVEASLEMDYFCGAEGTISLGEDGFYDFNVDLI